MSEGEEEAEMKERVEDSDVDVLLGATSEEDGGPSRAEQHCAGPITLLKPLALVRGYRSGKQ